MFGSNTSGVAIESSFPGIGLNSYYNAGQRKTISTGYSGLVGLDPIHGFLTIWNSSIQNSTDAVTVISPRLVIDSFGNIGVEGNQKPSVPLSFANTVGSKISFYGSAPSSNYGIGIQGSLMQFYTNQNNADIAFGYGGSGNFTENMRIKGSGNVGIGTSTPEAPLTVNSTGTGIIHTDGTIKIATDIIGTDGAIGTNSNNGLRLRTNGTTKMYLDPGGNIGIGTYTPAQKLEIQGKIKIVDGTQGVNKVLTSDANGAAS